jgi:hypothetical protein
MGVLAQAAAVTSCIAGEGHSSLIG